MRKRWFETWPNEVDTGRPKAINEASETQLYKQTIPRHANENLGIVLFDCMLEPAQDVRFASAYYFGTEFGCVLFDEVALGFPRSRDHDIGHAVCIGDTVDDVLESWPARG